MCNSRFSAKSSLYVHIKKHHSKVDSSKLITSGESQAGDFLSSEANQNDNLDLETELQTEIISREIFGSTDTTLIEPNAEVVKNSLPCPVETCTRTYTTKSSLRAHVQKMHGSSILEDDVARIEIPENVADSNNTDFIVYTPYSMSQSNNDQMIMVAPCDAVVFSSSESNDILNETDSLKVGGASVLKRKIENQRRNNNNNNQGSARTGLTYADVFKLKEQNAESEETAVVGAQDVILGSSDLGEGFLFTEDIPSMYFQDECQVLLLDPVTSENTINLRDIV